MGAFKARLDLTLGLMEPQTDGKLEAGDCHRSSLCLRKTVLEALWRLKGRGGVRASRKLK